MPLFRELSDKRRNNNCLICFSRDRVLKQVPDVNLSICKYKSSSNDTTIYDDTREIILADAVLQYCSYKSACLVSGIVCVVGIRIEIDRVAAKKHENKK